MEVNIMVAVKEFSWEEVSAPDFENPARIAWREAVSEVAERAKAALPETVNGRIEKAVALVLAGDVELLPDGKAKVASQSNGTMQYVVCNGTCECRDFAKAEGGWCKHRAATAIYKRASALAKQKLAQLDGASFCATQPPTEPPQSEPHGEAIPALPEAPASVNCHITLEGRPVQVTLRDTDETRLLTRLAALLRQYPIAQPPAQPPAHNAPQPTQPPVCQWHGAMRESSKAKGTWYCPAKMADGSYCKERWPAKGQ